MPRWNNWSGRHVARPSDHVFIRSIDDAAGLVKQISSSGQTLRVAGAGHSHSPLVPTDGVIVDTSGLAGVISTDASSQRAWVWSGSRIFALGRPLHDQGLALFNQGDIDQQAIAGAISTGTHGTGHTLKNVSSAVTGLQLITADGTQVVCSDKTEPDLFQAARLSLGAVGLITQVQLQLRSAYKLKENGFERVFDDLTPDLETLCTNHRHFEFFWHPQNDIAVAKVIDETDEDPSYPLAQEGRRCGWNYEVLPNHRPHKHTEMEYSVPRANGPECLRDIRDLIRKRFPTMRWPVEYRTVAADDLMLSMASNRATVTISVHQGIDEPDEPYFRACEEVFKHHLGRPHWGKVNYLSGADFAALYPAWEQWWTLRDRVDPDGVFLNEWLRGIRPD
ncbi:MAG: FAD-binding protein [Proteobacteria bacterium]|nr:FAD-binding protein [Pseudomonadota bacterium]